MITVATIAMPTPGFAGALDLGGWFGSGVVGIEGLVSDGGAGRTAGLLGRLATGGATTSIAVEVAAGVAGAGVGWGCSAIVVSLASLIIVLYRELMMQYSLRLAARLAILLPGIVIAYFSVRDIFPYFDRRLPLSLAILFTYALAAYVLIPALIRLFRILNPPSHLPLYCVTPDGFASDPINVGIIGTRWQLITAMEQSGWHVADPHTPRYLVRHLLALVLGWPYPTAPVSSLYLFGRKQDIAFEIPVEGGAVGARHHVRFWATTFESKRPLNVRNIHWHHRSERLRSDNLLWVGAASLDVGLGFIRHNMQITHMIHPDTNQERQLIIDKLRDKKLTKLTEIVELGQPYLLINRVIRGYLHSDGKMAVISLQTPKKPLG